MKRKTGLLATITFLASCGAGPDPVHQPATPAAIPSELPPAADLMAAKKAKYDVHQWFPGDTADTLLTNMVTWIYKRPTEAINQDRSDPRFRYWYLRHTPQFTHLYHHLAADGTHWFYLIRPARSVHGDLRGVGGRFRTNAKLEMLDFEEVFNTPIMPRADLERTGLLLFEEMLANGNVDKYLADRSLIEWPDDRLKYDKDRREWRYVD
jgi:hypothetical protein